VQYQSTGRTVFKLKNNSPLLNQRAVAIQQVLPEIFRFESAENLSMDTIGE